MACNISRATIPRPVGWATSARANAAILIGSLRSSQFGPHATEALRGQAASPVRAIERDRRWHELQSIVPVGLLTICPWRATRQNFWAPFGVCRNPVRRKKRDDFQIVYRVIFLRKTVGSERPASAAATCHHQRRVDNVWQLALCERSHITGHRHSLWQCARCRGAIGRHDARSPVPIAVGTAIDFTLVSSDSRLEATSA